VTARGPFSSDIDTASATRSLTSSVSGASGSGSGTGSASAARAQRGVLGEQRRSVEHAEHMGDVRRFRAGALVAVPTWCVFGILDWVIATWSTGAPSLIWFWSIRWGMLPVAGFTLWGALKPVPPGPRFLRVLDLMLYCTGAYCVAVMSIRYHGIASGYLSGIMMVIVARGAFSAQRWKRALFPNLATASSFPAVMGIAAVFMPEIRAQLHDPAALSIAVNHLFFIYGTTVLTTAGTHYAWTIRRQLFESRSIGRYRLDRRIAAGGMGEVWAAYHPGLKRNIALKVLRADAANDDVAVARFEREVKATSDLSHPNTIRVFDFGVTDDGIFYYAMELLEGMTLFELVKTGGPMAPARAVHLVIQAARSLAEAHQRGIVHRDVKPANIFVTRAGGEPDFVKVLDFGIAKRVTDPTEDDAEDGLTGTGLLAGTPKYMAPELVLGSPATPRSDIYGIGAVLYFLLAGRAPFDGVSASAIYAAHLSDDLVPPSVARGETIPADLERIVSRCLAKEPNERFADAGALADALFDLDLRWNPLRGTTGSGTIPPEASGETRRALPDDPTVTAVAATKTNPR